MKRFLAGVMYCGEREYQECLEAIRGQRCVEVYTFCIENLPNKEAHDALYSGFMERSDRTDFFVKVDADMVIENKDLFARVADRFAENAGVDQISIGVLDFFSDRLINGMHFFRNTVIWPPRHDDVFTDHTPVPPERMEFNEALAPTALHCPNPEPFYAFHFGAHKGVKLRTAIRVKKQGQTLAHFWNIELTWRHFLRNPDTRLGLAALGAELAISRKWGPQEIDYTNPYLRELYERRMKRLSTKSLFARVHYLRLRNRLVCPQLFLMGAKAEGLCRFVLQSVVPKSVLGKIRAAVERSSTQRE